MKDLKSQPVLQVKFKPCMKALPISLILFCSMAFSQEKEIYSKDILYLEVRGNSDQTFSLNYERDVSLLKDNKLKFVGGVGIGIGFADQAKDSMTTRISVPVQAMLLYGRNHNIELNAGLIPTWGKPFTNTLKMPPVTYRNFENTYYFGIGYRYTFDSDILVRANPMIEFPSVYDRKASFAFGISLGYAF